MSLRRPRSLAIFLTGGALAGSTLTGLAGPAAATGTPVATATPTAVATETATSQPSPQTSPVVGRPSTCTAPTILSLDADTVVATRAGGVTVGATPGSTVRLHAASRPSSSYRVARERAVGQDGRVRFDVVPPTTTRMFAQQVGCDPSETVELGVRTSVSLSAFREGPRSYRFEGRVLPGGVPTRVVLFRIDPGGREVLTSTTESGTDGIWRLRRQFLGSGRFGFLARTPQTATNLPGASTVRPTVVF